MTSKKYLLYKGDRLVETYATYADALAHQRYQETHFNNFGWSIVESEVSRKLSEPAVANLVSLVANTVDLLRSGDEEAVAKMMKHIDQNKDLYGYPSQTLQKHIASVVKVSK
jgi:hypothetical protein